ncbi:MAG: hypothetical protein N2595_05435, partial [bacterium]|nr:hypothetical protein [bacterium]
MRVRAWLFTVIWVGVVGLVGGWVWWRYVPLREGEYEIGNEVIRWRFGVSNGVLRTLWLERRGGERLRVSGDDFEVWVGTAESIGWAPEAQKPGEPYPPLLVRNAIRVRPAECVAVRLVRGWRGARVVLHQPVMDCRVILAFSWRRGEAWMRRTLWLASGDAVKELATDRTAYHVRWAVPGLSVRGGGIGQPVRLGESWFFGLEHPCGEAEVEHGVLALKQTPGYRFGAVPLALHTMVVGGGRSGEVNQVLNQYVAQLRRPVRSVTLYNTWCDMRGRELTVRGVSNAAAVIQGKLAPYGAALDLAVIDDGWYVAQSVWEHDTNKFPGGMQVARDAVGVAGMKLGLWLPLSGHSLDTSWGRERGLEVASPRYYCMSGTNYNRALRERLRELMADEAIDYFKHDFNFFWCGRTDHGHFPSKEQSTEANVNALLKLLAYEARLHPRVYLAITTGIWPSPWWLPYVDTIWMGGGDHEYNRAMPASRGSAFEMNYRDGALYTLLVERGMVFPLSALMTHGVVDGRHTPYNMRQEDDEGWANYLMNYVGRGTLMREFYISPENLSQRRWEMMARAIRWARQLDGCMANAQFILGNPNKGEVFGYSGWSNGWGYVSLRNPRLTSEKVTLGAVGVSGGVCEVVYPWHEVLAGEAGMELLIPDEGVVQLMVRPQRALDMPLPCGVRAELVASTPRATEYVLSLPEGGGNFTIATPVEIRNVSGAGVTAHEVTGVWHVTLVDADSVFRTAAKEVSGELAFDERGRLRGNVYVPRGMLAKVRVVYKYRGSGSPVAERNGRLAGGEVIHGDGWRMLTVPCVSGSNTFEITVRNVHAPVSNVLAEAYVISEAVLIPHRLRIEHDRVRPRALVDRPLPVLQDRIRTARSVTRGVIQLGQPRDEGGMGLVTTGDLARAVGAVLVFEGFDVNGGQYSNKCVYVNGELIGLLPENPAPISSWHAQRMELPAAARAKLKLDNVISIVDRTGDMYKLRGLQLVVALEGGREVRSEEDGLVYSTSMHWAHGEGQLLPV